MYVASQSCYQAPKTGHLGATAVRFANEALYRVVAMAEVVIIFQVWRDTLSGQALGYLCLDYMGMRLTGAL